MGPQVKGDNGPLGQIEFYTQKQDAEATLHWARNSYFLVSMSFLVVAYGLSLQSTSAATNGFHILIIAIGIAINAVWLFIQFRSSQYILYYKNTARTISEKNGIVDPYPRKLGGVEMRKLAYFLPIIFIVFWVGLAVVVAFNH